MSQALTKISSFNYFQPTDIRFGCGRLCEAGEAARRFGRRTLLVTCPASYPGIAQMIDRIKGMLSDAGLDVRHFDGVIPNPTTESVSAGALMAREHNADVVIGMGGGSSMDTAKAIAVEATHAGTAWDYLFFKTPPTEKTLPVIAVSTTSGTGSQVTQVAVMTETATRTKSAIYHPIICPRVAIVDPELMISVPEHITAATGFDVFCHAFESYLHSNASPITDTLALEAIGLVFRNLPSVVRDGTDIGGRSAMALADTLAGLCIANAGVTLPHGVGMAISGMYPQIMHGESLAIVYPSFMRFTWASAPEKFARVARILNPSLAQAPDDAAAMAFCDDLDSFLKSIGMRLGLADFGAPEHELDELARAGMVLPDYKSNPRIATSDEMLSIIHESYRRN
ncbi:MAG: iron-containing alcohol dehydrogenase [bacterium]|nr:iron-containing alcohol dehydrogenase [Candidatus Sumerlaeota bacterium]